MVNGVLVPTGINNLGGGGGSGTVTTADSIQGTGASGSPIELVGDSASPGNTMLYGTNGSGTKGWYAQPSGGGGGGGSANVTPDTHPTSPTPWDDEFEFGTVIDTTGARRSGANAWTMFQGTSAPWVISRGSVFGGPNGTTSFPVQTLPVSGSWTFEAKIFQTNFGSNQSGFVIGNRTAGKAYNVFVYGGSVGYIQLENITSTWLCSFNSNLTNGTMVYAGSQPFYYLLVSYDGSAVFTFSASNSGLPGTYQSLTRSSLPSDLGGAPLEIGLGQPGYVVNYDWFRRTA
jgi:hypothetical protein